MLILAVTLNLSCSNIKNEEMQIMKTENNRLIVVLGMHRSGTSAITRGLQVLGVDLGANLQPAMLNVNEKGFFEDNDIVSLNVEMIASIHSDWHHLAPIEMSQVEKLRNQGYHLRAVELLSQKAVSTAVFGFKDPRVAKLLPFWKEVFDLCQFNVNYVLALRHPLSVVKSLAKRDGMLAEQAYLLWLGHVIESLIGSADSKRMLVDYDRLMQSPDAELMRISKELGLEINPVELQSYKTQFLDQELRHTVYELNDLLLDNACPPIVREVYAALIDVASDKTTLDDKELQNKVACWADEFERLKSPLLLADRLYAQKMAAMHALTERDGQITNLNQALTERDGQITNLNQALIERDEQKASLNQALAERDVQIANLNKSVVDRDRQISVLAAERDQIFNSTSWRLTRPVRTIGTQLWWLKRIMKSFLSANSHGGENELKASNNVQFHQKEGAAISYTLNPQIGHSQIRDQFVEYQDNPPIDPLVKLIAFYLPQFHPFPENDTWWGKGFTEWTNVGKALPNYFGHHQPHCPIHFGYYDLRVPEAMEEQAKLAKEYGIYGFSYYFYWFGGKILMDTPLELMLGNKKIDIPFCLTWANENWSRRWDGLDNDILIAQNHSDEDSLAFIRHLVKYFKDERYIRIDGKPVLIIYRANSIPNMVATANIWREEVLKHGIPGLYLISAQVFGVSSPKEFDFDASVEFSPLNAPGADISHALEIVNPNFKGHIYSYEQLVDNAVSIAEPDYKLFRTAILSWDNTARKQNNSQLFHGFSLRLYRQWLSWITKKVCANPKYAVDEKIVFVNAWNEWAEGTHLEPDRKFGYGYLQTTYDVLQEFNYSSHQISESSPIDISQSALNMETIISSNALRNEIVDISLTTPKPNVQPLHEASRLVRGVMRLIRIYKNYRQRYPGFGGFWQLTCRCVNSVQSEGIKGLRKKLSLLERNINNVTASADVVSQHKAYQIDLLQKYFEKGRILNPTIVFDHNLGGGANIYSRELVKTALADGKDILRIYNIDCSVWFVQWIAEGDEVLFYTRSCEELFKALTFSHSANIIVNSLYGCPDIKKVTSKIVKLVQALNATLDYKVNDFFSHCPSPHLSDFNGSYCGVPQAPEDCKQCLKQNLEWYPNGYPKENQSTDVTEWRYPFTQLFEIATTLSFFDSSSVEIFRRAFHLDDCKIRVVPHSDDYFEYYKQLDLSGPIHIGVLGTFTRIKGVKIVHALSDYIDESGLQIPITVVGACYEDIPQHINVHGPYEQNQLSTIIGNKGINVILSPSIVPETFGYTISEAMKMGLPIVTFDIGAQGSRVKQYELGQVVPLGSSPEVILAAIQSALKIAQEIKK